MRENNYNSYDRFREFPEPAHFRLMEPILGLQIVRAGGGLPVFGSIVL